MSLERGPIFIAGPDRSGKTQLRRMLGRHPNLAFTRRTYMWTRFYNRFGDLAQPTNLDRCLNAMLKQDAIQELQPDEARLRREFAGGEPTYARLFGLFHQHHADRLGKLRWGDQLGTVERFAAVIFAAYPGARMIQMVRDPRQRYLVSLDGQTARAWGFGSSMAYWLQSARLAEGNLRRYPNSYMILRYESLAAQPEAALRAVCAFIGEDFDPIMLEDAGPMAQDEDRLDATIDPRQISPGDTAFARLFAGRVLDRLGYRILLPRMSAVQAASFLTMNLPVNLAGMLYWRVKEGKGIHD